MASRWTARRRPSQPKKAEESLGTALGTAPRPPNPQVQAIRARVDELVRRYDEALAEDEARAAEAEAERADGADSSDSSEDADAGRGRRRARRPPAQWKVGDVLLAAHSALARTGARTERAMVAELAREDPEVAEAVGHGDKAFAAALDAAVRRAQQTRAVLARSLAMVQQLQEAEDAAASSSELKLQRPPASGASGGHDALLRDKQALLAQLQEQLKAHREVLAAADEAAQTLRRAQLAVQAKADELRAARDEGERRAMEADAATQQAASLRDKLQLAAKAGAAAEARVMEAEARTRALGDELARAAAQLTAAALEAAALRVSAKESDAARLRAEGEAKAAADAALLAKTQFERAASDRSSAGRRAQAAAVEDATRALLLEREELARRADAAEEEARALASSLREATARRQQFERDNYELARVVREMQERLQAQQGTTQPQEPKPPAPLPARSSSFSISLRTPRSASSASSASKKRMRRTQTKPRRTGQPVTKEDEDDLSTTSGSDSECEDEPVRSPEAAEAARDEAELNDTMHQVVERAFPRREAPADALEADIARFEAAPPAKPLVPSAAAEASTSPEEEDEDAAVARVRAEAARELARVKAQYVAGLLEYKALVVEQYERRQGEERARHRLEIERLILLVQTKFRREMARRSQRVAQAQASLKQLYRAMTGRRSPAALDGVHERGEEEPREEDNGDEDEQEEPGDEPAGRRPPTVPLKAMLRAAILAMSSSAARNAQASAQIARLYEAVRTQAKAPRAAAARPSPSSSSSSSVATKSAALPTPPVAVVSVAHAACQVSASDLLTPAAFTRGLRGSAVAPEDMAGVVLPSAACFPRPAEPVTPPHRPSRPWSWTKPRPQPLLAALDLEDGAPLADRLVLDVRRCLPRLPLPPSARYVVTPALRRLLLRQLVRFFADADFQAAQTADAEREEASVAVGSPRDTPFMRRKALEGVARGRTLRRQRLARAVLEGS